MTTPRSATSLLKRPTRADARRNYDRLIEAAREAFQEEGGEASLEAIARRAEVGIGTLYRNFPTRTALLEAVYAEEVEAIAAAAQDVSDLPPWEALERWLRQYARYAATKRAISDELIASLGADSPVLAICRTLLLDAGDPLVKRAQEAGELRDDITFLEIARMLGALVTARGADDAEKSKLFGIALDGLRAR